ncbi:lipopolysaccharide biosynthesis protein [Neptunomonas concharum]|uniref:Oligosaccharide flippase family protein n=1 Tax=Neptunomonas concharum TaxID=1031538 RepID=A0A5P1R9M8_9GAMM|nr:hypothetical protein [Neptunomonas concharum]QEQ95986.1 hypothetical protein F0U83_04290 [Neptunomonas concharum]
MIKKLVSVFFGNGLHALSQLLLVVYMGRFLGEEVLSEYVFSVALCSPVYMFFGGGVRNLCSVDVQFKYSDSNYFESRLYFLFLGVISILSITFFLDMELGYIFYYVLALKILESGLETLYGAFQRVINYELIRNYNVVRSVSVVILICFMLFFDWFCLRYYFLFQIFILVFILLSALKGLDGTLHFDGVALASKIFCLSLSFGVMAMVSNLNLNLPRFFLGLRSSSDLAIYALLYQIVFIGSVVVIALSQFFLPVMAKFWSEANYKVWFVFLMRLYAGCGFVVLLSIFFSYFYGVKLFNLVFGVSYSVEWLDIALMQILGLFSYCLNISSVAFQSSVKIGVVKWGVYSTFLHGALLFFLTPLIGVNGAVFSTIAYLIIYNSALLFLVFKNYYKVKV